MKRICSLFLTLALALSVAGGLSSCFSDPAPNVFYLKEDLSRYVSLSLSDFSGRTVTLEDFEPLTDKDIRERRLHERYRDVSDESTADVYESSPAFGDNAYIYYELYAAEEDIGDTSKRVATNLRADAGPLRVDVGYWEFPDNAVDYTPLFYNEALSDALQTMTPIARRTSGTVGATDILRVTFRGVAEDGKTYDSANRLRIDMADPTEDTRFLVAALLDAEIGQTILFEHTLTVADASVDLTYSATVDYAATEDFTSVAVDLPEDTFDADSREELRRLNGTTAYLNVAIDYYQDYDVPEVTAEYLEKEQQASMKNAGRTLVLDEVFAKKDLIKKLPKTVVQDYVDQTVAAIEKEYWEAKQGSGNHLPVPTDFPYTSPYEYAIAVGYFYPGQFASLREYAEYAAQDVILYRVAVFYMLDLAGIRPTEKEMRTETDKYLENLVETEYASLVQEAAGGTPDLTRDELREEILDAYDGYDGIFWAVEWTVATGLLEDYIRANNTWKTK